MLSQDSLAVHAGRNGLSELGVHAVPIDLSTTAPLPSVHDGGLAYEHMATGGTHREGQSTVYQRLWNPTVATVRGGRCRPRRHPGGRSVRHRHGGAQRRAARRRRHRQETRGRGAAAVRRKRLPAGLGRARQRRHVHDPGGRARRAPPRYRPGDPGDAGQPEPGARRYRRRCRAPQTVSHCWWTTPSPARSCSGPSGTVPRMVLHSATKFLGGHGDAMGGVVAAAPEWTTRLRQIRAVTGGILTPWPAYLLHRGLATLPVRVRAQQASAQKVAVALAGHGLVRRVYYPGLPECDPQGLDRDANVRSRLAAGLRGGQCGARRTDSRRGRHDHARGLTRRHRHPDPAPGGADPPAGCRRCEAACQPAAACRWGWKTRPTSWPTSCRPSKLRADARCR